MRSLFRVIGFALQDIVRNLGLSFMTVFVLILMLLSVNTLFVIRLVTGEATRAIRDQLDVSIHFEESATDEDIKEVSAFLETFPEVTDMTLYSRDEVLEKFTEAYEDNPEILAALGELGENPLGATIVVKTREPGDYEKIISALSVPEYDEVLVPATFEDTRVAIQRIDVITTQVERFSFILSIFFAVIAFLIIFNTIRIAIYTRHTEISIKKLVGASNWFIRGPYLTEAALFSVVSVAAALVLIWYAIHVIDPYIGIMLETQDVLTTYLSSHIVLITLLELGGVLVLTLGTSWLAMRRHLRA